MKRETFDILTLHALHPAKDATSDAARDALDTITKLRAENRDLKARLKKCEAALREAVAEFDQRGESPWAARTACANALALNPKHPKGGKR